MLIWNARGSRPLSWFAFLSPLFGLWKTLEVIDEGQIEVGGPDRDRTDDLFHAMEPIKP
jgi:hypothetical protein